MPWGGGKHFCNQQRENGRFVSNLHALLKAAERRAAHCSLSWQGQLPYFFPYFASQLVTLSDTLALFPAWLGKLFWALILSISDFFPPQPTAWQPRLIRDLPCPSPDKLILCLPELELGDGSRCCKRCLSHTFSLFPVYYINPSQACPQQTLTETGDGGSNNLPSSCRQFGLSTLSPCCKQGHQYTCLLLE